MSDPASHEATVTIEQTVRIAASPSTVWSFWMDPELLTEWWARAAEVVPEAGGLYRIHMNEGPGRINQQGPRYAADHLPPPANGPQRTADSTPLPRFAFACPVSLK